MLHLYYEIKYKLIINTNPDKNWKYETNIYNCLYLTATYKTTGIMLVCCMVFNAPFNNISIISWRSVLLVKETTDLSQVTDKLYHIMLYTSPWSRFELISSVVIGTDCIGCCKSNNHTITATTAPLQV